MTTAMIKIGNSKGIRLSKTILEKYQIQDSVELDLEADRIILRPIKTQPRKGWAAAFRAMHENGDDELLIDAVFADENLDLL
jgi:antitoxin MazE